ncbi:nucleoside recognition family protein [Gibbsiella quercinecans]|uniref:nucleoside recognition domain-containing protein n=1 Tax=Gibbsiella quercinecans TaxID=929813 RepID=UPI000EF19FF0|nr:nucleoside recognition domain-containing protein [Gibbsiella quercinecans]RLM07152.1 nucleoside recognition family protein [Gibbsiella quercinecans]
MDVIGIIISAGKSSVDVALYTLLPIMVVMLVIMKFLEVKGVLDVVVKWMTPLLRPFGLSGMSTFAMIQLNFVSFAAPLATLSIMEKRGVSDRHLAATLAMVFAMGQGNTFYPLTPFGLHWGAAIVISIIGGLSAAALTYHWLGRKLSMAEGARLEAARPEEQTARGIINGAGSDAIRLAMGSVPMLLLSMVIVGMLTAVGVVSGLEHLLSPLLAAMGIPEVFVMPTLVKCLAGGTAYFGVISDLVQQGKITASQINASSGLLVQTFDLPGIGIFLGVGSRFTRVFRYAAPGAMFGILVRTLLHLALF